jgi:hypothetical protein
MKKITRDEWLAEGEKRFGKDPLKWKFICPSCRTVQTPQDLVNCGVKKADLNKYLAFSCIGRFGSEKGCDWTLGGLLRIHELEIIIPAEDGEPEHTRPAFEFADGE